MSDAAEPSTSVPAQAAPASERSIVNVTGDLYRAQNVAHYTVFLVTPDGIILSDPINRDFADWLKAELDTRFGLPVRYVAYSHVHWDHASGGEAFADTAEFVGQEAMGAALAMPGGDIALPANARAMDANGDGRLQRSEAEANFAAQFANFDEDGDGALSGAEIQRGPIAQVFPPTRLFAERTSISLGGKTVEMTHLPVHSPDMTVLRFPEEDAVFFVDFISVKRLPFQTLPGIDIDALLAAIREVEAMDFSIAIGGHGDIGTKQDVVEHRHYLEDLRDSVAAGIAAGLSLEELQSTITMDAYADWGSYDAWLGANIEGMHRILTSE
jgi:glyoxylase-like metal-dependent hydrolase (beta-lactamase superfamily II)